MAFDVKKLVPVTPSVGDGNRVWYYNSTDAVVTDADGYFSNSQAHWPFKVGDLIMHVDNDAPNWQMLMVASIDSSTLAVTVALPDMTSLS
jgi:hypothetical protein